MRRFVDIGMPLLAGVGIPLLVGVGTFVAVYIVAWSWFGFVDDSKRANAQVQTLVPLMSASMGATTVSNVQMTAITNAAAQTVATPAATRRVEIQAQDNNIRWRSDGTAPTATVGNIIYAGDTREFDASLGTIKLISTGGDAIANVHFAK